jgi:cell division protein FtsB
MNGLKLDSAGYVAESINNSKYSTINEEVAKKQVEIDQLKAEKEVLGQIVADLDFRLMELEMGGK